MVTLLSHLCLRRLQHGKSFITAGCKPVPGLSGEMRGQKNLRGSNRKSHLTDWSETQEMAISSAVSHFQRESSVRDS